jgi:hypothetical protein
MLAIQTYIYAVCLGVLLLLRCRHGQIERQLQGSSNSVVRHGYLGLLNLTYICEPTKH